MFQIYRNLHTVDRFSIRRPYGRVIDRLANFVACDVTFKVNEAGRQRVLQERKKNVHAFVVCDRYYESVISVSDLIPITYNPYIAGSFVTGDVPISSATRIAFSGGRCYLMLL